MGLNSSVPHVLVQDIFSLGGDDGDMIVMMIVTDGGSCDDR